MDDLKLFAKDDPQLEILLSTVKMFSDDVGLDFALDKCAKLTVNRGRVSQTGDVVLDSISTIRELHVGETYKYLGFHESEGVDFFPTQAATMAKAGVEVSLKWTM